MILHIIVGGIVMYVIGMLWYGPLFGKAWMSMSGMTTDKMQEAKQGMKLKMTVLVILTLITVTVVYKLLPHLSVTSFHQFWKIIMGIWVGFGFPVQMGGWLWERKPVKLVVLHAGQSIVSFSVLSMILYYWH